MGAKFKMNYPATFSDFLTAFFELFNQRTFRRTDYINYLKQPETKRTNDEAPIVDNAIVGPLLELLGFARGEQVYNQQRRNDRPDFAPTAPIYGNCFMVEDKNTSLKLDFDLTNPDSHLSQLTNYVKSDGLELGWLTNGKQLTVWNFEDLENPKCIIDLDVSSTVLEWQSHNPTTLMPSTEKKLHDLFDLFRKDAFTDIQKLEKEIAKKYEVWYPHTLKLGTGDESEAKLVEALKLLITDLQRDARRILDKHLTRYNEYSDKVSRLSDASHERATQQLKELRSKAMDAINSCQVIWGLESDDIEEIENELIKLEQDARAFSSSKALLNDLIDIINVARKRKYATKPKSAKPMTNLDDVPILRDSLQSYIDKAFAWHQRKASLRQTYRDNLIVYDDYSVWKSLVHETMLGGLNEDQSREEFALQAAYVIAIRLLLIRICEDKEIFPHRFLSDGGLQHWQEDIERYLIFTNGNPYSHLLDMAYENAQNIYAHFFTGRELFNWYYLDKQHFVMALHQLSRFNFERVDSDIIGTIYNTYVSHKEKRDKGQYYTPSAIVNYILDNVGYSGRAVLGSNKRLIDPACGSGTFLVQAAKRLVTAYRNADGQIDDPMAVLERVQQNLFGFDLNPFACYLSEVNLLIQVLDLIKQAHKVEKHLKLKPFHIYNVDALARPTGKHYFMNFNTLLAEESDQVDQIKSRAPNTPYTNGFAFVVANPPYGATLSETYKTNLRSDWDDVFFGQPDTYIFFLKFGLDLLPNKGRLGFITSNTYLMGKNSAKLRGKLLNQGRIEQIVDLPQGIWPDAAVDCVLMFLTKENDENQRRSQQIQINLLEAHDTLEKLTKQIWLETLVQQQSRLMDDPQHKIDIRYDALAQQIEEACFVPVNNSAAMKVMRLGDIADYTQGIIVSETKVENGANPYIKPHRDILPSENDWKPLLDGDAYVGRYELRWGKDEPHIKYGPWLYRSREQKFFESPKLVLVRLRNKSLRRRLIATYDDTGFFNRDNFNDIITKDTRYNLKYILALFNSSLLNYWYRRRFDNVNINPDSFRDLPIYPADSKQQDSFVLLVDEIMAIRAELNKMRAEGFTIKQQRSGAPLIKVPYDKLLRDIQIEKPNFPITAFFDAKAMGLFKISDRSDLQATVSSNIFISDKHPTNLVLRYNKLWLEVPDDDVRRYLSGYLSRPQWRYKTWDDLKDRALIPEDSEAFKVFFAAEKEQINHIITLIDNIHSLDTQIDELVLDLYGIINMADRQRVLGSTPLSLEEDVLTTEEDIETSE